MFYRSIVFLAILIIIFFIGKNIYSFVAKPDENEQVETIVPPLGLPPLTWPADNPYSKAKEELGHLLYFDKRLSSDHTISCASCHTIECGYSDCRALPIGIQQAKGTRHSPTIINTAYAKHLFWDGRAKTLEEQCKGPIANVNEMSSIHDVHEAHQQCVKHIKDIPGYVPLFRNAFGHEEISIDDIAKAIATFERTLLSGNSPYDRYVAGDRTMLSQEQIQGMKVFKKVGCANCHAGFNFTDERFLNIGIGVNAAEPDVGRYGITHDEKDWAAFKVPTLREVEHTGPYMHDGSLTTLEEVVDYYDKGGNPNKNLHPLMKPLHLSPEDKKALVSFMKSLSGGGWTHFREPDTFPQ